MNFLDIFKQGIRTNTNSRMKIISVFVIILIPLMYAFLFLKAFWDPYGSLNHLPVAIVNEDKGFNSANHGKDLIEELKDNKDVEWHFVSSKKAADKGLKNKKYYAEFIIPKDFSKKIESASVGTPEKAHIDYYVDGKNNFLATLLTSQVEASVRNNLSEQVTKNYTQVVFDNLDTVKEGFTAAANGSSQLKDGIDQLSSNIPSLQKGIGQLDDGASSLKSGTSSMQNGLSKVGDAGKSLKNGYGELTKGVAQLKQGANDVDAGVQTTANAISDLTTASQQLNDGAISIKKGAAQLASNVSDSSAAITAVGNQLQKAVATDPTLLQNPNIAGALQTLATMQAEQASSGQALTQFVTGVNQYADKMVQYTDGMSSLNNGAQTLKTGTKKLNSSMGQLSEKTNPKVKGSFGEGLYRFIGVIPSLQDGATSLNSGALKLNNGLSELSGKMPTLKEGTTELSSGATTLSDELRDGANKMAENSKSPSEALADFIANPITPEKTDLNHVPNYGTGFTSYFLPLSLWVAALMMTIVLNFRFTKDKEKWRNASNFDVIMGRFSFLALFGIVQAILSLFALKILGVQPTSWLMLFIVLVVGAFACIAIVTTLVSLLGKVGQAITMILLILQMTASGGTFPTLLSAKFFVAIHPFMPFTYLVNAIREVVAADPIDYGIVAQSLLVLLGITVGFLTLGIVFRRKGEDFVDHTEAKLA